MAEFAIIASYEDGDTSVHYYEGTKEGAIQEAENTRLTTAASSVAIAMTCGFIGYDGDVSTW